MKSRGAMAAVGLQLLVLGCSLALGLAFTFSAPAAKLGRPSSSTWLRPTTSPQGWQARDGLQAHSWGRSRVRMGTGSGAPPKIIIAGAPASGKGTQCELIKDRYNVVHLSTGDILRAAVKEGTELGKEAKGFMDRGELVPDNTIIGVVQDRLNQEDCESQGWLLDGFPRTKAQADALAAGGVTPDSFILLDVPDELLVERVVGRRTDPETGKIYHLTYFPPESDEVAARLVQRSDDTEEKVRVRIEAFKKHCDAIVGCYGDVMTRLDGTLAKEEVYARIEAALGTPEQAKKAPAVTADGGAPSGLASVSSLLAIVLGDALLRKAFVARNIAFPSSLAGMMGLFSTLLLLERAGPGGPASPAERLASALEPGALFLAKWLPVFFVPSLVVLPLVAPTLSRADSAALAAVVLGGWLASLVTTAGFVQAVSVLTGISGKKSGGKGGANTAAGAQKAPKATAPKGSPAFSAGLVKRLGAGAFVTGAAATAMAAAEASASTAAAAATAAPSLALRTARSACLLFATLFGFTAGARAPKWLVKVVHPLVTCTATAMAAAAALAAGTGGVAVGGLGFRDVLGGYITKSRCPVHLGAGDLLLGLLGPSVVSFAVQMYRRRELMSRNLAEVAGGTAYGAASGLFGTAALARVAGLPPALRLATLPRTITSPLAMAIAAMLGADASLVVALVVVTGVVGANFGAGVLDTLGIKDPAARGLATGASAHGLGTAAMVDEPDTFAFSAVSMALTATISTLLVSSPPVREALFRLALASTQP